MMFLRYSVFVLSFWTVLCVDDSQNYNCGDCSSMVCPSGTNCKMEPKPGCEGENCPMEPKCIGPCATVRCSEDKECVEIYVNCIEGSTDCNPGLQPICIPKNGDPCKYYTCPKGEGCYVSHTDESSQGMPYCQDPCEGFLCDKQDEYCYPEQVNCVQAPCNPIPTCKAPCDTVECAPGSKCVIPHIGIPCQNPPCRPQPICVAAGDMQDY